jgi:hypothetical protein
LYLRRSIEVIELRCFPRSFTDVSESLSVGEHVYKGALADIGAAHKGYLWSTNGGQSGHAHCTFDEAKVLEISVTEQL